MSLPACAFSRCLDSVRCSLIENNLELNGNASTRLMKSIISSNRDLQRSKSTALNKVTAPSPIGTQFALTMLGMHKNSSNSLQQHVSSTLGTLIQVQNSLSTPPQSCPNDKSQPPASSPSPQNRSAAQKPSTLDSKAILPNKCSDMNAFSLDVSSSDSVEFGSKRASHRLSSESSESSILVDIRHFHESD